MICRAFSAKGSKGRKGGGVDAEGGQEEEEKVYLCSGNFSS